MSGDASNEYAENGMGPVATYTATDPEGTAIVSWMLGGTDAGDFHDRRRGPEVQEVPQLRDTCGHRGRRCFHSRSQ